MLKQLSKIRQQFAPLNAVRQQRLETEAARKNAEKQERDRAYLDEYRQRADHANDAANDLAGLSAQETRIRDEAVGIVNRIERDSVEIGELLARIEKRAALDEQDTDLDKQDTDRIKALRADRERLKPKIAELARQREKLHSQIEAAEVEYRKRRQGL